MAGCSESAPSSNDNYYQMMENVFVGHPRRSAIEPKINLVLRNFSRPVTNETAGHVGSVLVAVRKSTGVPEMNLLDCVVGLGTSFQNDDLERAVGLCGGALAR